MSATNFCEPVPAKIFTAGCCIANLCAKITFHDYLAWAIVKKPGPAQKAFYFNEATEVVAAGCDISVFFSFEEAEAALLVLQL
jgi:hypothetical protein